MIKVKYTPSQSSRHDTFNIEDYGISMAEWEVLANDEKERFLRDFVEHEPPYWTVDYFTEKPE